MIRKRLRPAGGRPKSGESPGPGINSRPGRLSGPTARPPAIDIAQALADRHLLGAALGDVSTWATWLAVLKSAFGISLNRQERRVFTSVAGSRKPPAERVRELWAVVGRRGGKSRAAAAIAVYIAAFIDHRDRLAPGEVGYVLSLSPTMAQAQLVFAYCLAFLEASPILKQKIEGVTRTEIRLAGNIVITVHPCSYRTVRGRTLLACVFDEAAQWRDETSASPDVEVYRAVIPALLTTNGMLVGISTPYRKLGLLYTKHRDHFGQDDDSILVVRGPTTAFNPTIKRQEIDRAKASDPEAAAAEWLAEFRDDVASLLDEASIEAAIDRDRPLELPYRDGVRYFAFIDSSGGRHDHYTICIGHKEGESRSPRFVADVVRGAKPPFNPQEVTKEFVDLAKAYGCQKLTGDAFSGEWLARAVKDAGARYEQADMPKSALYLEAVPVFARGAVSIPNHARLIRELRLLERRTHRSGKDTVDHPQYGGSDDYANALVGCIRLAVAKRSLFYGDWVDGPNEPESSDSKHLSLENEPWSTRYTFSQLGLYGAVGSRFRGLK